MTFEQSAERCQLPLDQVNAMVSPFLPGMLDIQFTDVGPGYAICRTTVTPRMLNPGGILHGGVPYTMADTSMAIALLSSLSPQQRMSTIEIKISYFKAATEGELTCSTRIIRHGKRIVFLESDIEHGGRLIAKATGTYYVS